VTSQEFQTGSFAQEGGLRFGFSRWLCINFTWPFGSIVVRADHLILSCLWNEWRFEKREVTRIEEFFGTFSRGVRIVHSSNARSKWMVFWSNDADALMSALEQFGYAIDRMPTDMAHD
jgi:hypothetical protein